MADLMKLRRNIIASKAEKPVAKVYGVEWNYADPSTVLKRTGAAANFANPIPAESLNEVGYSPFDNVYPWSEMKRYNIINGEVAYSEDDAGYSETLYDTMVYIPEFYYYANKDTTNQKWYWSISAKPLEGYEKHPGSGRYVGRFHTSGSSSGVYSKSGVTTFYSNRANSRSYSHNKGKKWYQIDIATLSAIQLLYLIEFADFNSQSVLGRGTQTVSSKQKTGSSNGAIYHTIKRVGSSNLYRWLEDLFSNVFTWIDGCVISNRYVYVGTNPENYSDTINNFNNTNIALPSTNNYISDFGYNKDYNWAFIPALSGGKWDMFVTDYVNSNSTGLYMMVTGGHWNGNVGEGLFLFTATYASSYSQNYIGSRLIYIPTT